LLLLLSLARSLRSRSTRTRSTMRSTRLSAQRRWRGPHRLPVSTGSDGAGQSRWHVSSCHHALSVASALVYVGDNVVGIKARSIGANYSTG
jgi:hypothetical protein